jgi:hypothetical protein
LLDGKPADERDVLGDLLDAPASRWSVSCHAWLGRRPGGRRDTWPCRCVDDDQPGGLAGPWVIPAVAGWAEDAPGVLAAPTMTAVRAKEHVAPGAAVLLGAGAPLTRLGLDLPGQQFGEERRQVDE